MGKNILRALGFAATVASVWVAGFGDANALLVRGSIDPLFNASGIDGNLGWTAAISFDVASNCVAPNTTLSIASNPACFSNLSVTGTLYDHGNGDAVLDSNVDFQQNPTVPAIPLALTIGIDGAGIVNTIDTSIIGYYSASTSLFTGNLWIDFFTNGDGTPQGDLIAQLCDPILLLDSSTFDRIRSFDDENCDHPAACATTPVGGITSAVALVTITQVVPEPGALWLAALGLCMIPVMRRRARRS